MRLCRYHQDDSAQFGFYKNDEQIIPLAIAAETQNCELPDVDSLLAFLPGGEHRETIRDLQQRLAGLFDEELDPICIPTDSVSLLVPIPDPPKLMLLAGNYRKHVEEQGGKASERDATFPYVFMKPPSTTLTHPGAPIHLPDISPDRIDWELELGVIMGKRCKAVKERDALDYVAGYTVVNDISDRGFRPNPTRDERPRDAFFDWLHGKWHDSSCPMGPCILPADELPNPQSLQMTLKVNRAIEQDGSTSEMVYPVAAVIEFVSSFVTLEPGDIISTGTTSGVGAAKGRFLKRGDLIEAEIEGIGILQNPVE
jgi:2,4-didehydro-3-deoxy-L-rhamnonate hydrolase